MNKCMHSVLRIRTDIYVGLGLINCVLISLAFILLQSILFVGYSAVGLDGEIFEPFLTPFSCDIPASPLRHSPFQHHVSGQVQSYERRECSECAFMLRGVSGNAPKKLTMVRKIHLKNDRTSEDPSLSGNWALLDHCQ